MNTRSWIGGLCLGGLLMSAIASSTLAQERGSARRNIIFILVDDQRYDALSYVDNAYFRTPHLDELARGGILFENAFVTTSLCSPSRASILTGQYAHKHQVLNNSTPLQPGTPTFPAELQKAGYETAFIGKWHMGGSSDAPRPGFDHWVSFRGQGVYTDPVFNINGERENREGYITDLLTDYAEEFIRRPRDKPFLLYLSHKAVHSPFTPAERHLDAYKDRDYPRPASMTDTEENYLGKPDWVRAQRESWHGVDGMYNQRISFDEFVRQYAEALLAVDDSVGRVMETLREEGLLRSTLIIFTSDNGFQFGEHGLIDKRTMYEASIRVPLIVHCPDLFGGGARRSEMILNIDFAPTILEAGGVSVPSTVHGKSFFGLMTGAGDEWRRGFLYEYFWERAFPQTPSVLGIRTGRYKLIRFHGVWDLYELYDLENDPAEMNNLIAEFSVGNGAGSVDRTIRSRAEPELRAVFDDLTSQLDRILRETGGAPEPSWLRGR